MRWFVRLAVAGTLSALAVVALTWAGWPRPRFVVSLPETESGTQVWARRNVPPLDLWSRESNPPPFASRAAWLGFVLHDPEQRQRGGHPPSTAAAPEGFWFVNLKDGRTRGPVDPANADTNPTWQSRFVVPHYDWDAQGAAVVGFRGGRDAEAGSIGRLDPETGQFTHVADDRSNHFLLSANGATLLTFTPPQRLAGGAAPFPPPGDADFVAFDLTAEPPTRTRLDFTIPGGQRQLKDWSPNPYEELTARVGSYALSPDGLAVAVSETWRRGASWNEAERVGPLGVTLYDTRTGRATGRVTDYGPSLTPGPTQEGAFGLTFAADSRSLLLYRVREAGLRYPPDPTVHYFGAYSGLGEPRVIDLATRGYAPPPHPGYRPYRDQHPVNLILRTDDGALRTELEGNPTRPNRFRVVAADGTPRCDWRPLAFGDGGNNRLELGAQFVPGTTGMAWLSTGGPEHWLVSRVRKLLKWPQPAVATDLVWYDWAADQQRVVCRLQDAPVKGERLELFVQPDRLAVLRQVPYGGTVEVWDAPPPRRPLAWSVPAGVALGVLLTAAGVRLRRRAGEPRASATGAGARSDSSR